MTFYFWAYWVFKNTESPFILRVLLLGCFWGVITVFMINIFFKISMHTSATGSMIGILMIMMFLSPVNLVLPFFIALIIAGLIGTSRMILKAHYLGEIWAGYIIGILVQVAAYLYLK
jgi:membrane-associated phospholipid phosphatase